MSRNPRSGRTRGDSAATALGIVAVAFWSASVGLNREVAESLGPLTAAASVFTLSGSLGCALLAARGRLLDAMRLPRRVLLSQGSLFVVYLVSFSLAVGTSAGGAQLVEIGLINYLWPGLTLALSVPMLRYRARWTLPIGIAASLAGVAVVGGGDGGLAEMPRRVAADPLPYALCLVNVVAWSLYSNLARSQAARTEVGATPLYLLVAGAALGAARLLFPEESHLGLRAAGALGLTAVFPALLSYWFWDRAMRAGNMVLVASVSYLIPLFSTVITSIHQGLPMSLFTWIGSGLLVAGALICRRSVVARDEGS